MAAENKDAAATLFVGNLPSDISDEELKVVFTTYGQVTDVRIMPKVHSQTGHACAFVTYTKRESAEDAIEVLDSKYKIREGGDEIPTIKVSWPAKATKGGGKDSHHAGKGCKGDHDKGFGGGKSSWQGKGPSAAPEKQHGHQAVGSKAGGGKESWHSAGHADADTCQPSGSSAWPDRRDKWTPSHGSRPDANPQEQARAWNGGGVKRFQPDHGKGGKGDGKNGDGFAEDVEAKADGHLFVGNLPGDIDEASLQYVFGHYGKVNRIRVMTGGAKSGQSCAFIEYQESANAVSAILTLSDKYEIRPGDGPIMVKNAKDRAKRPKYS